MIDEEAVPKEADGLLWIDRIRIDEARCVQCGDCVRACMEENPEKYALSSTAGQRLKLARSDQIIEFPTALQAILRMSQEQRNTFWQDQFRKCIKCYGCIEICPVYIKEFKELDISRWVPTGQIPPSYPLFHLIRAYHVWDTCVGCGECERTCPAHIPLKMIQDLIRYLPPEKVFDIIPGLPREAQDEILAFVESREGNGRRMCYGV